MHAITDYTTLPRAELKRALTAVRNAVAPPCRIVAPPAIHILPNGSLALTAGTPTNWAIATLLPAGAHNWPPDTAALLTKTMLTLRAAPTITVAVHTSTLHLDGIPIPTAQLTDNDARPQLHPHDSLNPSLAHASLPPHAIPAIEWTCLAAGHDETRPLLHHAAFWSDPHDQARIHCASADGHRAHEALPHTINHSNLSQDPRHPHQTPARALLAAIAHRARDKTKTFPIYLTWSTRDHATVWQISIDGPVPLQIGGTYQTPYAYPDIPKLFPDDPHWRTYTVPYSRLKTLASTAKALDKLSDNPKTPAATTMNCNHALTVTSPQGIALTDPSPTPNPLPPPEDALLAINASYLEHGARQWAQKRDWAAITLTLPEPHASYIKSPITVAGPIGRAVIAPMSIR